MKNIADSSARRPHRAVVNGTALAVQEEGDGVPVVFVHGSAGALDEFGHQVEHFSRDFRVVVYSRRYHPPNEPPREGEMYSLDLHAEDLAAMITASGSTTVHVVGASYGGFAALLMALRHPARVRSLVLCEPPILPLLRDTGEGRVELDRFLREALIPARAAFTREDPEEGVRSFLDGILGHRGSFDGLPPSVQKGLLRFAPELRLEFLTPFEEYMPTLPAAQLRALLIPVLLLDAERSPKMFHHITDGLARLISDADRATVPGSGHAMHIGNPTFFNDVVGRFIRRH